MSEHTRPQIVGILNLTEDSFSDGGRYLEVDRALEHALRLVASGADVIELGPASSHPDAKTIGAEEEIRRLEAVVAPLEAAEVPLCVDSFEAETQRWCIGRGVAYMNDVTGFPEPAVWSALAQANCRLVVMHSSRAAGKATRDVGLGPEEVVERVTDFFEERLGALIAAGIDRDRLIIDPGMGFFLSRRAATSVSMLKGIARLRTHFALPVLVSVSRKSFLGVLCRDAASGETRPVEQRDAATLAAELFAARQGVDYIRTHDVRALSDALEIEETLEDCDGVD